MIWFDDLTSKNCALMGISWGFDGIFMRSGTYPLVSSNVAGIPSMEEWRL